MKTIYPSSFLAALAALSLTFKVRAADLCVAEFGAGGCYATITAALAAANDGDRILIFPKPGNAPYVEALTINKSVTLMSNVEGQMWALGGTVTIVPAIGRKVTIMHMHSTVGNITASTNSPAGPRCEVNIINCELADGNVNFDYNYFNLNLISSKIMNGHVRYRYGNLIGNDIYSGSLSKMYYWYGYSTVYLTSDAQSTNDTLYFVGNIVRTNASTPTLYDIVGFSTTSQFVHAINNYIAATNSFGYSGYHLSAINFLYHKASTAGTNIVENNTMYFNPNNQYYTYPVYVSQDASSSNFDVRNNLSWAPNLSNPSTYHAYRFSGTTTSVSLYYNHASPSGALMGISNNGTNNLSSNSTFNTTTAVLNAGSNAINGGHPGPYYYDLDLSANDAGARGGSFALDNFHPVTGAARVYFVKAPRALPQNYQLNIRANAFDR
ncbi:MAG: hypothetical protein N2050_03480 [Flavobacteriales bacterium]|nr:hypothetical protein [Flavobacteriales bacterium]